MNFIAFAIVFGIVLGYSFLNKGLTSDWSKSQFSLVFIKTFILGHPVDSEY